MRQGHWRVGMGMATATYPANRSPASASARVLPDGSAVVQFGSQDLGTGTYTVMTQVAADALGIAPERIRFELGDSRMPKAPVSGGSQSVASVAPAVQAACAAARDKLVAIAVADSKSPLYRRSVDQVTVSDGRLQLRDALSTGESISALLSRHGRQAVVAQAESKPGAERDAYSMHSFGAVFAEVWVDADLGVIRLPRLFGAYAVASY
jgi:xanthine dehydrogenase YagR molybdenum-binding subunit